MEKVVTIRTLTAKKTGFSYWLKKPETERLAAIELLQQQYIKFKYGNVQSGFQRVCAIIK
ncbi:MAG TPA: hypothetical protein VKI61_11900 [Chitinophagaceae bacterium]|nr:hypothetical protein [Chitinophagaceae bacterium]